MLGDSRWSRFLNETAGDEPRALDLYIWHSQLTAQLQELLSYLEIAMRNAFDQQIRAWVVTQTPKKASLSNFQADWCMTDDLPEPLGKLIGSALRKARDYAQKASNQRATGHPRHGQGICHDDILVQVTFGGWTRLLCRPGPHGIPGPPETQLWVQCLHLAFPKADPQSGQSVGSRMEAMRQLRNRVAHHDSLLSLDIPRQVETILSLLAAMDPQFADIAMSRNRIREILRSDPRK